MSSATMMRNDGEMATLLSEGSMGLLPDVRGPWLPWSDVSTGGQKLTIARLVGMALAPLGPAGSTKVAMFTVDDVRAVKGNQAWTDATLEALYDAVRGHEKAALLSDGLLHTAKNVPADLLDAEMGVGKIEVCWHDDSGGWKGYKKKNGGADADKLRNLTVALRQEFQRQEHFKTNISTNGIDPPTPRQFDCQRQHAV